MFFLFIAVYIFRLAHRANASNSDKAVESLLALRLYMNMKQAVGSENIYGVLNVFVKKIRVHLCYLWEIPSHDDGSSYSFIDSEMRPLR